MARTKSNDIKCRSPRSEANHQRRIASRGGRLVDAIGVKKIKNKIKQCLEFRTGAVLDTSVFRSRIYTMIYEKSSRGWVMVNMDWTKKRTMCGFS